MRFESENMLSNILIPFSWDNRVMPLSLRQKEPQNIQNQDGIPLQIRIACEINQSVLIQEGFY